MLVSVIIPCYKQAQYLGEAIESCLAQTYKHIEIIVVDDGSPDNTSEVTAQYAAKYPQVRGIRQENMGQAVARKTGIKNAKGEFLQFLDSDDTLLPTKIERCMEIMLANPDVGVVYTDAEVCNMDLTQTIKWGTLTVPVNEVLPRLLIGWTPTTPHGAFYRRSEYNRIKGFRQGKRKDDVDWLVFFELVAAGVVFHHINEKLVIYRRHQSNYSSDDVRMRQSVLDNMLVARADGLMPHLDWDWHISEQNRRLAFALWSAGKRKEARTAFRDALVLRRRNRMYLQIMAFLSYFLDANSARSLYERIVGIVKQTRTTGKVNKQGA
jgi:glycosyltransferase involved in cell wall biosynthesis